MSNLPFYTPPTEKERLEHLASLPWSAKRGITRMKPMDVGLWDEAKRQQIDLIDWLKGGDPISPAG